MRYKKLDEDPLAQTHLNLLSCYRRLCLPKPVLHLGFSFLLSLLQRLPPTQPRIEKLVKHIIFACDWYLEAGLDNKSWLKVLLVETLLNLAGGRGQYVK